MLALEEIGAIGRFLLALGAALADMVDERVLQQRMNLDQYAVVLGITEIYHNGYVVIGTPDVGVKLAVGDEVIVFGTGTCSRANLESMRILDNDVPEMTGDGAVEVGLRLSRPVPTPAELRKIVLPAAPPKEIQLELEEMTLATADAAETDFPEIVEAEPNEESGEIDEVVDAEGAPSGA